MLKLESHITRVPKIGDKYQKLLEKLEIKNVQSLIYHFPFRYDDYSITKTIDKVRVGDTVTVKGTLLRVDNIYTKYRKRLTRAKIEDHTDTLEIIWFNQHYLKKTLQVGQTYNFSGKIDLFNKNPAFISPEFEKEGTQINTGRLVPIYPETRGVSSKWLRSRINDVLTQLSKESLEEFLPPVIIKRYNLETFETALKNFHFPQIQVEVDQAKSRFAFEELFLELLRVEKRRFQWQERNKGHPLNLEKHQKTIDEFTKNLPFELTDSQKTATDEILKDLTKKHPMNRILEGDVGSGKTIVAIIASYLTCLNGYQTLYMAPTEILAKQHFQTFENFLKDKNINIKLLTGSSKNKKLEENPDILIGTHALLHLKEPPKKVGLVVIDEQHRFGVEQRAQLTQAAVVPHVLTMTATPIPRTLALTLYGDLSMSVLKEVPNKGKKITTKVVPEKMRDKAYKWIKAKQESTFIVCPLIEESEHETLENVKAASAEFEKLKEGALKGMSIGLLHGRMRSKEKQEIIQQFREGKIKVLVSTPVIEVGIDIPDATIIVIESAERYGLASLHQLRGRVGRGEKEGYCFTFMSSNSKKAYARLKNLEKINNGLKLAEIDMSMRGQGDLYGTMQHGFKRFKVADIYDLELLEKAKIEAQNTFPKLDKFPKLKEHIESFDSNQIINN